MPKSSLISDDVGVERLARPANTLEDSNGVAGRGDRGGKDDQGSGDIVGCVMH
jgi:hypothetical protein